MKAIKCMRPIFDTHFIQIFIVYHGLQKKKKKYIHILKVLTSKVVLLQKHKIAKTTTTWTIISQ